MAEKREETEVADHRSGWFARRYMHLVTGLVFLVIAVLYLVFTFDIRVPPLGDPLGPRLFPLVLGALFLGLTVVFLAGVMTRRKAEDDSLDLPAQRRAWVIFGLLLAFVLVLPYAGFPIASVVFVFVVLTLLGYRTVLMNLLSAALMAAGFYLLFDMWLGVPLPALNL